MTDSSSGGVSRRGSHRLSLAAICPRKWYFRFHRGIEPRVPVPHLVEGTLVHLALAYYWAEKMPAAPKWYVEANAKGETLEQALVRKAKGNLEAVDLALRIRDAYRRKYETFDVGRRTPVAVEHEFEATLAELAQAIHGNTVQVCNFSESVTSRIDLLVRMPDSGLWAVDYKTVGRATREARLPTWNPAGEYALSWQFLLQYGILKARFGPEFRGIIVERVSKVPPFDFERHAISVPSGPLRELPRVVERLVERERELSLSIAVQQSMPDGHPWSCFSWGRPCEYRDLCLVSDSPSALEALVVGGYQLAD